MRLGSHRPVGGQGVVEYGLILAGSAVVTVVTLVVLGPLLADFLGLIARLIDAAEAG